jgi:DNA-binding GntR family transcriptional regulator
MLTSCSDWRWTVGRFASFKIFSLNAPLIERIAGFIEKLIIEGTLKPRERLIETNLSQALGVSRPPVREALRALEREELVTFSHRRGVTVTEITEKDVQDVYLIRSTLESLAVKLAAKNLTKENLIKLEALNAQMSKASQRRDVNAYFQLNQEFHEIILEAANNQKLSKILKNLGKQTLRLRFFTLSLPGRIKKSQENHCRLLDALKAQDAEAAGRLRLEDVQSGGQILKLHMTNELNYSFL